MPHMDSTVEMVLVMEAQESLPQGCGISATDADTCLLCGGMGEDEMALSLTPHQMQYSREQAPHLTWTHNRAGWPC